MMNAKRRAIAADLRFNGFSGKEAYEQTKTRSAEWRHIQIVKGAFCLPGRPTRGKAKPKDNGLTWAARYVARKFTEALTKQKNARKDAQDAYVKRRKIAEEMKKAKAGG